MGTGICEGRVPTEKPQVTLSQLRSAIPAHCFQRSLTRSSWELVKNITICTLLFIAATCIDFPAVPRPLSFLLWPLYWFWQGAFLTGIWVLAHECGHGAFSEYKVLNDVVGLTFHSLMLVPYFSWKHSHRRHHQNTGSIGHDEVFVPATAAGRLDVLYWNQPLYRLAYIFVMFTLGWPMYLLFNASGRHYDRFASHFLPSSPIFNKSERNEIILSDLALGVVLAGLGMAARSFGIVWLIKMYGIPLMAVNLWLVLITFMQHTHPNLPHFDDSEWEWLRGALCTVDRTYGILDHVFHHIGDTHVVHHLFSQLPHYHAQEATRAVIPVLGAYYARDDRNIWSALWTDFEKCCFAIKEEDGRWWYHSAVDAPPKTVKMH